MVRYRDTLWCDGCGVEIRWKPVLKDQRHYCCKSCLSGEVCDCEDVLEEYPPPVKISPDKISALSLNYRG